VRESPLCTTQRRIWNSCRNARCESRIANTASRSAVRRFMAAQVTYQRLSHWIGATRRVARHVLGRANAFRPQTSVGRQQCRTGTSAPMKQLQGKWCLATFAGCHPKGTFGPVQ
jgi:hypothetical protein